jgi:hypothetical protein
MTFLRMMNRLSPYYRTHKPVCVRRYRSFIVYGLGRV